MSIERYFSYAEILRSMREGEDPVSAMENFNGISMPGRYLIDIFKLAV